MGSKYDRVKVKVHLDDEHYYILSRFILSKMLTACKLPTTAAVCVSLALKKSLVDQERLDISQRELEAATLSTMAQHGYGAAFTRLLPVMTRFFIERTPLIVFMAGSGCCGKTSMARSLSVRLNTHNIVSTDLLLDILRATHHAYPSSALHGDLVELSDERVLPCVSEHSLWLSDTLAVDDFVRLWRTLTRAIRSLVEGEVEKALVEGKVLIVEGSLIDLSLYHNYLLDSFQSQRGVIVVAFHISSDEMSRNFAVERLVSTYRSVLPLSYADNYNGALEWVQCRLRAIEGEHLRVLRGDSSAMQLHCIDDSLCDPATGDSTSVRDLSESYSNETSSTCDTRQLRLSQDNAEIVPVYGVTNSMAASSRVCESMHGLILDRIISALKQKGPLNLEHGNVVWCQAMDSEYMSPTNDT
ncbi:hypothetical protein, conserved [Trypanosoma brucei gambiense DAL972]|uniref:Zeta toxin domain-containing protein n=1 Tax=Trypanosoma brucei gambiense (strain MHOM/CI/86/DAL972) TaxID=679716 RepID=C9ZZ55_TRYB9|nr:hypothetical protein, conserved [Trypanosoma brucei gambiense DAL972]CBH14704.1 hypothetical protein, conserved [Trypanosoma brucei gambiense DAL972]|eukprot:XP_011776970.1 hypothetical protein, conserved [Trypanosoma brucei gambiense DAL972]